MSEVGQNAPRETPQIPSQQEMLAKAIDELQGTLNQLSGRLSVVCMPAMEEAPPVGANPVDPMCDLAAFLRNAREKVDIATITIKDLHRRLQLP